jgi:hypothetical protein
MGYLFSGPETRTKADEKAQRYTDKVRLILAKLRGNI